MFATEKELFEALHKTAEELAVLTKSWDKDASKKSGGDKDKGDDDGMEKSVPVVAKAEDDDTPPPAPAASPAAEGDSAPAAPDAAPPEPAPAPEASAEPDAGEGGGDMTAEVSAYAQELSDQELDMMLHVLMEEKDARAAGPADNGAPPPAEGDMDKNASLGYDMAMSIKKEFAGLAKSMKTTQTEIAGLKKSLEKVNLENAALRKKITKPTSDPAAYNNVQVLEKSAKAPERLDKSEAVNWLVGEMRKGNKLVKADHVARVNASRSDSDFENALNILKSDGIELPTKK